MSMNEKAISRREFLSVGTNVAVASLFLGHEVIAADTENSLPVTIFCRQLWDGDGKRIQDAAITIKGEYIVAVGSRKDLAANKNCQFIELACATILPGFIDMHVHLSNEPWFGQKLLVNGITSVRDTGNNAVEIIKLRQKQENGDWPGPRIFTYGPLLDAIPPFWPHIGVGFAKEEDVKPVIDDLVNMGVDGFKTYSKAPPWLVKSIVEYAHKKDKQVTCHLVQTTATEALNFNIGCIEHIVSLKNDLVEAEKGWVLDKDSSKISKLIKLFLKKKSYLTPTLAVMEAMQHWWGLRFNQFPGYNEYPPYLRNWLKQVLAAPRNSDNWDSSQIANACQAFRNQQVIAG